MAYRQRARKHDWIRKAIPTEDMNNGVFGDLVADSELEGCQLDELSAQLEVDDMEQDHESLDQESLAALFMGLQDDDEELNSRDDMLATEAIAHDELNMYTVCDGCGEEMQLYGSRFVCNNCGYQVPAAVIGQQEY